MSNFSLNDNLIVPEEYEVFLRNLRNEFKKGINVSNSDHLYITTFYLYLNTQVSTFLVDTCVLRGSSLI